MAVSRFTGSFSVFPIEVSVSSNSRRSASSPVSAQNLHQTFQEICLPKLACRNIHGDANIAEPNSCQVRASAQAVRITRRPTAQSLLYLGQRYEFRRRSRQARVCQRTKRLGGYDQT